jgi:signal transduction histidine kinase
MQPKTDGPDNTRGNELLHENARLRGDLLTVARRLSHDFRTPLGGIICSGEAMREILAETDPTCLPLVASVLDSAEELSQLVRRSSYVIRATALPEPSQLMPMQEAVTAALQRLERRILARGAMIIQPNTWPHIKGVSSWLETVWWNFLANALQHANQTPLQIELGWEKENEHIRFWIADNGSGVAAAKQPKLFQPFDQLHDSEGAAGLGLAIVQRLVDLQGGTCGYRENPQGGACFYFQLP